MCDRRAQKLAFTHLQHLKEGNNFLGSTVTEDEIWVHHHFTSQTKQARMQERHLTSPRAKRLKVCLCAGNLGTCSVFWDSGVIHTGKFNSKPFTAAVATASN